ncbi:MAG: hypothetical protein ACRDHM_07450 [Actinomycetota bacterium]
MPVLKRTVVASAARTATGQSAAIDTQQAEELDLLVDVTAVSGTTPTLDLSVEWSDNGTDWFAAEPADTLTQITATKKTTKTFDVKAANYRIVWMVGGTTPSFTFSVREHPSLG